MTLTKVRSTVTAELDELAERTIGLCLKAHTASGPGMNEGVYVKALRLALIINFNVESLRQQGIRRVVL